MKISPTSVALQTAMSRMMAAPVWLPWPKITLTRNDSPVNTDRAAKTIMYSRKSGPCAAWPSPCGWAWGSLAIARLLRSDQVEQREQKDPHDVDKVPVQAGVLQHGGVLRPEPPAHAHQQDDDED